MIFFYDANILNENSKKKKKKLRPCTHATFPEKQIIYGASEQPVVLKMVLSLVLNFYH